MSLTKIIQSKEYQEIFLQNLIEQRDKKIQLITQQYIHQILALGEIADYEHQEIPKERKHIESQYLQKIAEIRQEFDEKILHFSQNNSQKFINYDK